MRVDIVLLTKPLIMTRLSCVSNNLDTFTLNVLGNYQVACGAWQLALVFVVHRPENGIKHLCHCERCQKQRIPFLNKKKIKRKEKEKYATSVSVIQKKGGGDQWSHPPCALRVYFVWTSMIS